MLFLFHLKEIQPGVIELGTIHAFTDQDMQYLRNIAEITGVAFNTAGNRTRLKQLLEETPGAIRRTAGAAP
ncbi:MAG: hypothetical protein WDO16_03425 [Bacteroidota bacterium]